MGPKVAEACATGVVGAEIDFGEGIYLWRGEGGSSERVCALFSENVGELRAAVDAWGAPEPGTRTWVDAERRRAATVTYGTDLKPPTGQVEWRTYVPLEEIVLPGGPWFSFEGDGVIGRPVAVLPLDEMIGRGDWRFMSTPATAHGIKGVWTAYFTDGRVRSWRWNPKLGPASEHRRLIDMLDFKLGPPRKNGPSREYRRGALAYRVTFRGDGGVEEIEAFAADATPGPAAEARPR